jgi:DNA primase
LRRIFSVVPEVIFCFDGDRAGRDAAWRALQVSLPSLHDGRQVRFLLLPDGEDPDSLVRRDGAAAFGERLAESIPLSQFLLDSLSADVDLRSLDGKARLAALAKPLLAQLPEGVYRELLTTELARRVGLPRDRLDALLGTTATNAPVAAGKALAMPSRPLRLSRPVTSGSGARGSLSRQAIALLLHYPAVAHDIPLPENLAGSGQRGVELLRELHALARSRPDISTAVLLERFRDRPELPHLAQLLAEECLVAAEGAAAEFQGCLDRLLSAATQQELARLLQKAGQEALSGAERERLAMLQRTVVAGTTARTGPPS